MALRGGLEPQIAAEVRRAGGRKLQTPERLVARLAVRQHDVVSRVQLLAMGLTRHEIARLLRRGHLHELYRGVYVVGTPGVSQDGRWMAATLAAGEGAALSHRSAAALWNLKPLPSAPIEVILSGGSSSRRRGLIVHRSTCLLPEDLTRRRGIPVTTVARTLVDLATRVSERGLREAFYKAEALRLLDRTALLHWLSRAKARRGSGVLRKLLDEPRLPLADANPGLERSFVRFCNDRALPLPEVNAPLGDFTVDALWRQERLVVELDSWEFHRDRDSFEADRRRDTWLQANGYHIVRATDRRLRQTGDELEREIRMLLSPGRRT